MFILRQTRRASYRITHCACVSSKSRRGREGHWGQEDVTWLLCASYMFEYLHAFCYSAFNLHAMRMRYVHGLVTMFLWEHFSYISFLLLSC